jgi:hypothetical protein
LSGSGTPIVSGSGGPPPPPPWGGGAGANSIEALAIRVAFTPTSGTSTSAFGLLQAISIDGTDRGTISIHTHGLPVASYNVGAVTDSGSAVTLGAFNVNPPPATTGTSVACGKGHATFGGPHGIPFPDGVGSFDIATLAISDSNADVLFTADLTTITDGAFFARVPIVSGTTVTATGTAQIHAFAKGGAVTGTLCVCATGLADSTTYTYGVNGTDIGTVTSASSGSLKFAATENPTSGTLPDTVNLFTVTSVTITDGSGNLILTASF